jgi:hypothetical protein
MIRGKELLTRSFDVFQNMRLDPSGGRAGVTYCRLAASGFKTASPALSAT